MKRIPAWLIVVVLLVVLPVAVIGLGWVTRPLLWLAQNPGILLALVAVIFATIPIITRKEQKQGLRQTLARTVIATPLVVAGWVLLVWGSQTQLVASYTQDATVPSYAYRAPFVVADQLANRDLDDVIGDRVGVHAVQSPTEPNQYTSLVVRRGLFEGYEAVQVIQPPLVGARNQNSNACHLDAAHKLRLGGLAPTNNLGYALSFQRPFSVWDESDAYGFCDEGQAVVVVPLKRLGGFWPLLTERPDGVAVYRGGQLTVHAADAVPDSIIGPTYPRSLAAQQRGASQASGSFSDWIFQRAGFDTAGARADDESTSAGEPNAANAVDFSLVTRDGAGHYVTALTPVGASESVVALGHISNRQTSGELNPFVVSRYTTALPALSTTENRIRSDFNQLPGWASGMRVMEITPAADGTFVASVGQNQVVTYRMAVATDGSVTILDQAGGTTPATPGAPTDKLDPQKLSTDELRQLIADLATELAHRAR